MTANVVVRRIGAALKEVGALRMLVLAAAIAALVALAAFPVQAQVGFGFDQETDDTGDVALETGVTGAGDNGNQGVAPTQFGNTGNLQNAQGFVQYASEADDVEFTGGEFVFAPEQGAEFTQGVEQAAATEGW